MTQPISVVCPSCDSVLKVTKPSLIGKRVACPSCKKPVLIQAPVAAKQDETPKRKETATPARAARAGGDDLDLVLLADDDDPFDRRAPKAVLAPSEKPPAKKPRSSAVWKKMEEAETSEFEAMLTDTDEPDEPTEELPLSAGSSGAIRARRGSDSESNEFDSMLQDTDAEQDKLTAEMPTTSRAKRNSASKPKRAAKPDVDEFDIAVEDADLGDDDLEMQATPLRRAPAKAASSRSKSSASQKLPLMIGAFAGCSILMGLLVYSVSGAHAPSPLTTSPAAADASALAPEKDESAAVAKVGNDSPEPEATKAKADSGTPPAHTAVAAGKSGHDDGDRDANSPAPAASDPGRSPLGNHAVAATIGAVGTETSKAGAATNEDGAVLGRKIASFSATAVDNTTFQLADSKQTVLVVAFLGVECPLANLYYPRLIELATKYKGKSVGFLAINSNAQDTLDDIHKQARVNKVTFPVLKDAGNAVSKLFGAERTPEVFVLDAERTVRYHGMVDDQYGYRQRRSQPTKNYVVDAVDALLGAQTVNVAETPVQGCHIGRVTKPSETAHTSFYRDVLPVLQNRCQQCHRKGEIGPFALKDYAEVRDWGPTIREAVAERRMPPWPADPHFGKFSNDISLTQAEIQTITKWVDEGCPEGNSAQKPAEKKFVDGWNIGKPDRVFTMEEPFHVPATGVVEYQNIYASPVFTQDTWVQAVECRFGNRSVVHHMLVLLDFPKDRSKSQDGLVKGFFAAGTPGSTYFVFPKGYAKRIPKGARLRFQMHYTPNGSGTDDQSRFGIVLAKEPKEREVQTYALGKLDINIPAGNPDHMEWAEQIVNGDVILTTLMPHLHIRGKSFTFTVVWPDGKKEIVLSVPRWDFNWQPQYQLAKPIVLPKNSKIIVEAHWDNSADNPNNILPPVDVQFGEQTFDEMFIGYVNFIPKSLADASRSHGRKRGG
jgi:peroxiredoxin